MEELIKVTGKSTLLFLILLCSCSTDKKETFAEYRLDTKEGYHIQINSQITKKEYRGVITHADYGSTLNVNYRLAIKDHNWSLVKTELGSEEPKHLLICGQEIRLHVVGEYYTKQSKETAQAEDQARNDQFELKIEPRYKKLIDERYFFNLFGEAVWVLEEKDLYNSQVNNNPDCVEYALPNDNIYPEIR